MNISLELALTAEQVAKAFCELNDEAQADFFEHVGKIAETWRTQGGTPYMQWWYVGRHMRNCACVTDLGRGVVFEIANAARSET